MRLMLFFFFLQIGIDIHGQDAKAAYDAAIKKIGKDRWQEAAVLLTQAIALDSTNHLYWNKRGLLYAELGRYDEGLRDFRRAFQLNPHFADGLANAGTALIEMNRPIEAIRDLTAAINLDTTIVWPYMWRGIAYQQLNLMDSACNDFLYAVSQGAYGDSPIDWCRSRGSYQFVYHVVSLKENASREYGFSKDNPVKVGQSPRGQLTNEHRYFEMLRDAKGDPIKFKRLRNRKLEAYDTKYGGIGIIDQFRIKYRNEKGRKMRKIVFITIYEYHDPRTLYGFSARTFSF